MATSRRQHEIFHLLFLEPDERERFAGEARWAEVVERVFALLEAPQGEARATR